MTAAAVSVVDDRPPADTEHLWHDRPFLLWVGGAMVVALILRVAWVAWATRVPTAFGYDPTRYLAYAERIAAGKGYSEPLTGQPTAYYPPGYPLFLGAIAWFARHTPITDDVTHLATYLQAVLGTLTVGLVAVVGRRIAGPLAGIVAAVIYALYPNLVFHTGVLLSETLYIFLFTAFLAILLWRPWSAGLSSGRVLVAAIVLGLAIMVRPISLIIVPGLFFVWWWDRRDWRVALKWAGLTVAGVAICAVPWTIRNEVQMHSFVALSTNTGDNLCMGHKPNATGAFMLEPKNDPCLTKDGVQFGSASEIRNNTLKTSRALHFIRENPGREPWLVWRRFYFMFARDGDHDAVVAAQSYGADPWMVPDTAHRLERGADLAYWLVCAAGAVGLVRLALSRRSEAWVLLVSIVGTAIVPLAMFGDTRFKVPVVALLIIAAGCAVVPHWPAGRPRPGDESGAEPPVDDGLGEPPPLGRDTAAAI